jgi:hypothetical protein
MNHSGICDTVNLQPAKHSRSRRSSKTLVQPERSCSSRIESNGARAKGPTFAEDFMLEHSHSALHIGLFEAARSYGVSPRESHELAQFYGFPS